MIAMTTAPDYGFPVNVRMSNHHDISIVRRIELFCGLFIDITYVAGRMERLA